MKIPRLLIIRGAHWHVVVTRTMNVSEGEDILGLCDPSLRTIYIKKQQTKRQQMATLVHEILHAMEFEYDFNLTHKVIGKIENPVADFIRDNLYLFTAKTD